MTKVAILILTLVTLSVAAVPPGAVAGHCTAAGEAEYLHKHGSYYIVLDRAGAFGVYEETNGKKGLQLDEFFADTTCHGRVLADERIM